jgi:hypothetical protein
MTARLPHPGLIALVAAILLPVPALANAGYVIAVPLSAAFWWVAVVPLLIEWRAVFVYMVFLSPWRALGAVVVANLLSGVVGLLAGVLFVIPFGDTGRITIRGHDLGEDIAGGIFVLVVFLLVTSAVNTVLELPVIRLFRRRQPSRLLGEILDAPDSSGNRLREVRVFFLINLASGAAMVLVAVAT